MAATEKPYAQNNSFFFLLPDLILQERCVGGNLCLSRTPRRVVVNVEKNAISRSLTSFFLTTLHTVSTLARVEASLEEQIAQVETELEEAVDRETGLETLLAVMQVRILNKGLVCRHSRICTFWYRLALPADLLLVGIHISAGNLHAFQLSLSLSLCCRAPLNFRTIKDKKRKRT